MNTASRNLRRGVFLCVLCSFLQGPFGQRAVAHHSMRAYDKDRVITITGTVTKIQWANPHVYLYITQSTGTESVEWQIEGGSPGYLHRGGWVKDSLKPGDEVVVTGYPRRDASKKGVYPTLLKRGTQTLFDFDNRLEPFTTGGPAPEKGAKSLAGVWVALLTPPVLGELDLPKQLTPKGKQSYLSFPIQVDCVPDTAPTSMATPDLKRVTLKGRTIRIESELTAAQRVIHLDVKTHDGSTPSIQGHSIGSWDGKTLRIDTENFAFHPQGNGTYIGSGSLKHLVERLTLAADGRSLTYHFELTDPEYFSGTRSGEVEWTYRPNLKFDPPPCDVESARRRSAGTP